MLDSHPADRRRRRATGAVALLAFVLLAAVLLWPKGDDVGETVAERAQDDIEAPEPTAVTDEVHGVVAVPDSAEADDVSVPPIATAWESGRAASLSCNTLRGSDFANGRIPPNWFREGPELARVDVGGLEDSLTLQVGFADEAGRYAEMVPVSAGSSYWFRGWFDPQGTTGPAEMGIWLLDADEERLDAAVMTPITAAGFAEVVFEEIPDGAAFALPYVFKDQPPGVLLVDELVFGVTNTCFEEITAAAG